MRKRRMIQAAAVLMAAGILGGCSGSKEAASSGAEAAETKEAGGETAKRVGKQRRENQKKQERKGLRLLIKIMTAPLMWLPQVM